MTITVCKDCQERHTACWGSCEKYLAARAELDSLKEKRAKHIETMNAVSGVQFHGLAKTRKRNGIK